MPGQWIQHGRSLWAYLCRIVKWLYTSLQAIPIAFLELPNTLKFMRRSPRCYDIHHALVILFCIGPVVLLYYGPLALYHYTLRRLFYRYRRRRHEKKIRRLEPAALPSIRKRRLSQGHTRPQTQSPFLAKLPLEIRQMIYEEVIKDGASHRHIVELRNIKVGARNQLCSIGCKRQNSESCIISMAPKMEPRKTVSNLGALALAKSCRQMYRETIDLLYERQAFFFGELDKPPYMITGTLPQRLAKIRHIHLYYREGKVHALPTEYNSNCIADRKCSSCNFCHWLESITKFMTGLRTIEISLSLPGRHCPCPALDHAWVIRLLELQQRSKAEIKVSMVPFLTTPHNLSSQLELLRQTDAFMLELRKELTRVKESNDAVIDIHDN